MTNPIAIAALFPVSRAARRRRALSDRYAFRVAWITSLLSVMSFASHAQSGDAPPLAQWRWDDPRAPWATQEQRLREADDVNARKAIERDMLAILADDDATTHAQRQALRLLSRVGSQASVRALGNALGTPALFHEACWALETNPSSEATFVLRQALAAAPAHSLPRLGLIQSVGRRRDGAAVGLLQGILQGDDPAAADAAAAALGTIATPAAEAALTEAQGVVPPALALVIGDARLNLAESMLRRGELETALRVFRRVYDSTPLATVRLAALADLARHVPGAVARVVAEALAGADPNARGAALMMLARTRDDSPGGLIEQTLSRFETYSPETQVAVLETLPLLPALNRPIAIDALRACAADQAAPPAVRAAAAATLARLAPEAAE